MRKLNAYYSTVGVILFTLCLVDMASCQMQYKTLRIGTKDSEPLSFKSNGKWTGFDWQMMDFMFSKGYMVNGNITYNNYTIVEGYTSNSKGFTGLKDDVFDIWLASPTKTAAREKIVDFSHTFFKTGLKIVVRTTVTADSFISAWFFAVFTPETTFIFTVVVISVVVIAVIVWMLEMLDKKQEMKYFSIGPVGIVQAVAWAFNTILSPGYQKKPRHPVSRMLGTILGRSNILLTALITAVFTAATITAPVSGINSVNDLPGNLIAIIPGSTAATWVQNQGDIPTKSYANVDAAFAGFANDEVAAFVYDAPRILWWAKKQKLAGNNSYAVLSDSFEPQDYGIVTKEGASGIMEMIDQAVLNFVVDPIFNTYYHEWFSVRIATTSNGFTWTASHYAPLIAGPLVAIIIAVLVRTQFMKKESATEVLRSLDEELKFQKIDNVGTNDIGFLLAKMVSNQASLLRYSYLLTHRDRFYADQPISRGDIDVAVHRIRNTADDFIARISSLTEQRDPLVPPKTKKSMKEKLHPNSPSHEDPEQSAFISRALSIAAKNVGGGFVDHVDVSATRERPTGSATSSAGNTPTERPLRLSHSVAATNSHSHSHSAVDQDRHESKSSRHVHLVEEEELRDLALEITDSAREIETTGIPGVNPWQDRSQSQDRDQLEDIEDILFENEADAENEQREAFPDWSKDVEANENTF